MKLAISALATALALHGQIAVATVSLTRDGSGQDLLFPYATVEAGQSTVLAIENPTDRAKAIKYHVRESREGHVAASGNAYVPASGRWTLSLVDAHGAEWVALQAGDSGCLPAGTALSPEPIRQHEVPDGLPTGTDFWPVATVSVDVVELGVLDDSLTGGRRAGLQQDLVALAHDAQRYG